MKEVKFKQSKPYGCGIFAVANVLNDATFITNYRLKISEKGNTLYQLNQWLTKDKKDFIIEPIYMNLLSEIQPLPPKGMDFMPKDENLFFPFLLDTSHSHTGRKHLVACYCNNKGVVTVIDSLKENQLETTWEHLLSGALYNVIVGIYGFSPKEPGKNGEWTMLGYCD